MLFSKLNVSRVAYTCRLSQSCGSSAFSIQRSKHRVSNETWSRYNSTVSFRKQLKDEAKVQKAQKHVLTDPVHQNFKTTDWELTVGIEIHAQLNANHKLFSTPTSIIDEPNSHAALFDLSVPGSQPVFQKSVLLPALRAALALNCQIQRESRFDRKHYFYQDQPAGYQITQYYAPFAKDGYITLSPDDGTGEHSDLRIGIKQIQLEQDTAKTVHQPPNDMLLDFNRVGHPLIEIITLPHIHSPQAAAACVRKIQGILETVNSVTTGMELGGLRADVNVSVRQKAAKGSHSYGGIEGLGQRTEIKNLSSFKAVEDAIIAERNRQIKVLESGGQIEGETRGWALGSTETRKLRGKEGEVDYRYMPDPDIPPLHISESLVDHLQNTLPMLPDEQTHHLTTTYGITMKDAKTLVMLDRGLRVDFLADVLASLGEAGHKTQALGRTVSNWILHELGGLLSIHNLAFEASPVSPRSLSEILDNLASGKINGQGAKSLLNLVFGGAEGPVTDLIKKHNLAVESIDTEAYTALARTLLEQNPNMVQEIHNGKTGKIQWFVGQMMRESKGKMDAKQATVVIKQLLG